MGTATVEARGTTSPRAALSPRTARSAPAPVGLLHTSPGARLAPSSRNREERRKTAESARYGYGDTDGQPAMTSGPYNILQGNLNHSARAQDLLIQSMAERLTHLAVGRALPGPFGSRLGVGYRQPGGNSPASLGSGGSARIRRRAEGSGLRRSLLGRLAHRRGVLLPQPAAHRIRVLSRRARPGRREVALH